MAMGGEDAKPQTAKKPQIETSFQIWAMPRAAMPRALFSFHYKRPSPHYI